MTYTIIGIIGLFLILTAFFLENSGRLNRKDIKYDSLNLIGATFLIIYAINLKSTIFIILNGAWLLISLKDIIKWVIKR